MHNNKDKWLGIWHFAFVSGIRSGVQSKEKEKERDDWLGSLPRTLVPLVVVLVLLDVPHNNINWHIA